jgi:hypothetical protein
LLKPPRIGSAPPLTKYHRSPIPQRIGWDRWPDRLQSEWARSLTMLLTG